MEVEAVVGEDLKRQREFYDTVRESIVSRTVVRTRRSEISLSAELE